MTPKNLTRTIVVGYDGSAAAHAAVEEAIDRAEPDGRLILVHTYQVPKDYVGATYYTPMLEDASQNAATVLDDLERGNARLSEMERVRDLTLGSPAVAITRAAEVYEADEIVIGSRGLGYLRALLGSVAYEVIHRAHCPVTVIPERMIEVGAESPAAAVSTV